MDTDRIRATTSRDEIDGRTIISRVFDAPRELVFSAWTTSDHLQQWWGPQLFTNPVCEVDVRPGGSMRITMQAPDGSQHPLDGTFEEVTAPERLVFVSRALRDADGRPNLEVRTIATFAPVGEASQRTSVTLELDVLTATDIASGALSGMQIGWNQSLDKLDAYLNDTAAPPSDSYSADPSLDDATRARSIELSRVVRAPRPLVFEAFVDPAHVGIWWGPDGFRTTTHAIDVRPGGEWRFILHGPDGTDYDNHIIYDAIEPHDRLAYHHVEGDQTLFTSTVTFTDVADGNGTNTGTCVTLTSILPTVEAREQVAGYAVRGGEQTLGRLAAHVEARVPVSEAV